MIASIASARRRRIGMTSAMFAVAVVTALAGCSGGGSGPDDEQGWQPQGDVEWLVPYSPGGGFDTYSRGLAQVMADEGLLPDGTEIVIRNNPPIPEGITSLYTAAPDGQTIGILPMPATVAMQIQNPEIAHWDTTEFTVLGQVDENGYVLYVAADSPYHSVDDLIAETGLRSVATEEGTSADLATRSTIAALGLDATNTYGLEGTAEIVASTLRGDAEFFVTGTTDIVNFVESGDIRPLLFLGTEDQRPADLTWLDDIPSAADAGYSELAGAVSEIRIIAAPPDLPAEQAEFWRTTLMDTMESEAFAAWSAEAQRPIVPRDHSDATDAMQEQVEQMESLIPQLEDGAAG